MTPLVHSSQVSRAVIDPGSHCLVRTSCLTVSGDMLNPTYASERPPCTQLYNQYNVSLFSTYARQLTTQHHLLCWTWQLESVSMCQGVVRRHCIRHNVHESAALKIDTSCTDKSMKHTRLLSLGRTYLAAIEIPAFRDDPMRTARIRHPGPLSKIEAV
jgi:hypothetical protein